MIDDSTLLRRYATERTEEAFAELVRRHLPLVYSAAARRLSGDTHRAEDVAQVVFCAVARDAERLARHSVLTGWLYTATRNAVIDEIRTEKRRRAREEEAHTMQATLSDFETSTDWSRLRPVLDAAMDELNTDDREAVLLRFFQSRPFAEIGTALGLSEDAARKRVDRALDKLRVLLERHKIASTSAALAVLLASETIAATPAGLAASVTTAALTAGGVTVGGATFLTLTKLQMSLAAAAIAGGAVGLITQQRVISTLRENHAGAQQQLARLATENAALASARADAETQMAKLRAEADTELAKLRAELHSPMKTPEDMNRSAGVGSVVIPPSAAGTLVLGPLADTPEIQVKKDYWHHRYDPFFQQRGLTTAQGDRFVELKVHKDIAREDLQAAVQAADLRGNAPGVEQLRSKANQPIEQEMRELLGNEGFAAAREYELISGYRVNYVEPMLPAFVAAHVPLSSQQAERLVPVLMANDHYVQANPTDITTTGIMNWDGVAAQASGILAPEQIAVLRAYLSTTKPPSIIHSNQRTP